MIQSALSREVVLFRDRQIIDKNFHWLSNCKIYRWFNQQNDNPMNFTFGIDCCRDVFTGLAAAAGRAGMYLCIN